MTTTTTTTTSTTTRRLLHRRVNEFPGITARRPPHEVHGEMRQQPLHTVRYTVTLLVVSSSTRNLPLFFLILHCPPVLWANYSRTFVRIACIGSLDPKKKNIFTLSTFACSPHRFSPRGRTTQLSKASFTACAGNWLASDRTVYNNSFWTRRGTIPLDRNYWEVINLFYLFCLGGLDSVKFSKKSIFFLFCFK